MTATIHQEAEQKAGETLFGEFPHLSGVTGLETKLWSGAITKGPRGECLRAASATVAGLVGGRKKEFPTEAARFRELYNDETVRLLA